MHIMANTDQKKQEATKRVLLVTCKKKMKYRSYVTTRTLASPQYLAKMFSMFAKNAVCFHS